MNETDNHPDTEIKQPKKKSAVAIWITLIVLIALAGGGFYLWKVLNNTLTLQQDQLTKLQQQLSQTQTTVQTHNQQIIAAAKQSKALQDMAQQAIDMGNRRQKGWILAEADYLMRMATRRLQISRDVNGAIAALQGADQGLHETGDLTLLPVRQQLAKELAALKALHQVDLDGMTLALDQMSDHVASLPFKAVDDEIKDQLPDTTIAETPEKSLGDKIIDTIMAIGDIKIHHRNVRHASDEQQHYQNEHMLLSHLASARLAALRFDAKQFAYDINLAQQILIKYYDVRDNRVAQMSKDLAEFSRLELAPALPDISASWRILQSARNKVVETQK